MFHLIMLKDAEQYAKNMSKKLKISHPLLVASAVSIKLK